MKRIFNGSIIDWYSEKEFLETCLKEEKALYILAKKYGVTAKIIKKVLMYLGLTGKSKEECIEDALHGFLNTGPDFPGTTKYLREKLNENIFFGFSDHSAYYILHRDDYINGIIKGQCPDEPWRIKFGEIPEITRRDIKFTVKVCYYKSTRTGEEVWGDRPAQWTKHSWYNHKIKTCIFSEPKVVEEVDRIMLLKFTDKFGDNYDFSLSPNRKKIAVRCKKCGKVFERNRAVLSCDTNSIVCSCRYDTEWFIDKVSKIYPPGVFGYDRLVYNGANKNKKIEVKDLRTGEYFWTSARNFLKGRCLGTTRMSSGERNVYHWLKSAGFVETVDFVRDPYVKCLIGRGSGLTRIDFIIYSHHGKTYWIEYNGKQHYQFLRTFHDTQHDFEVQLERDKEEKEYCETNGIILISIPYTYNTYKKVSEVLKSILIDGQPLNIINQVEVKL